MAQIRLLPALMVTMGVVLSLKAIAVAEEAVGEAAQAAPAGAPPAAPTEPAGEGAAAAQPTAQQCPTPSFAEQAGLSPAEVQVLQSLGERRRQIEARAAEIEDRAVVMEAAERRLDERVAELRKLEADVRRMLGELDEAETERILGLVNVYQRMRAKDAAAVFNGLEEEVLVQVARRMRQQNLAEIMGEMQPEKTRRLTVLLAAAERPEPAAAP